MEVGRGAFRYVVVCVAMRRCELGDREVFYVPQRNSFRAVNIPFSIVSIPLQRMRYDTTPDATVERSNPSVARQTASLTLNPVPPLPLACSDNDSRRGPHRPPASTTLLIRPSHSR